MAQLLPIKKRLSLQWQGKQIALDVPQDLFSSHEVDRGSKLLLSSIESLEFPDEGDAVDFGCGYGVLGVAWQAVHPGWTMRYVDRDALAVAFAEHNVGLSVPHLADYARYIHDVTPPKPLDDGFGLVMWNVPGKAGAQVLQSLTATVLGGLAEGGLLALVVVNPLAADLHQVASGHRDAVCVRKEPGRDHTVLHFRKKSPEVTWRQGFDEGNYDRPDAHFALGEMSWELTPVVGLPEYDSLSHATRLAGEMMFKPGVVAPHPGRGLVLEPGVGHLVVLATRLWPKAFGHVASRDALALLSSVRALRRNCPGTQASLHPMWGIQELSTRNIQVDFAIVSVPDQIQVDELRELADAVEGCMAPGGAAVMHGGSTEIGRLERLMGQDRRWRVGKKVKHRGFAAIPILRRDQP